MVLLINELAETMTDTNSIFGNISNFENLNHILVYDYQNHLNQAHHHVYLMTINNRVI